MEDDGFDLERRALDFVVDLIDSKWNVSPYLVLLFVLLLILLLLILRNDQSADLNKFSFDS